MLVFKGVFGGSPKITLQIQTKPRKVKNNLHEKKFFYISQLFPAAITSGAVSYSSEKNKEIVETSPNRSPDGLVVVAVAMAAFFNTGSKVRRPVLSERKHEALSG